MLRRLLVAGLVASGLIALGGVLGYWAGEASDGDKGYFIGFAIAFKLLFFLFLFMVIGKLFFFRRWGRHGGRGRWGHHGHREHEHYHDDNGGPDGPDDPEGGRGDFGGLAQSFNRMVDELRRTDQLRRNLTADVAHELRTPLHVIRGNLEGIQDKVYEPTSEHIAATLDETRLLGRLVDDLNTLALAESGQLPLVKEELGVGDLLEDVAAAFASQAESAGIALESDLAGDGAMTIFADAGRLQQVMGNLVSNAVRHTPAGGTVSVRASTNDSSVKIEVSDTGEGIRSEDLPFVFDRFWRGEPSRARTGHIGGGPGLAIARQLVEAHGGEIDVRSGPGEGTTFSIDLPIRVSEED